ncbi:hypothetical protein EVAR_85655_1 [Eumeta japonica]|uniref:Uncharacterized protein n=1 Tax=Eumeta variegata TaxID=151549 RepID=A0A4C1XSP0_EUMVA|nr:hypothetical protein EVAR_85655_1 [Eumeta japonica]
MSTSFLVWDGAHAEGTVDADILGPDDAPQTTQVIHLFSYLSLYFSDLKGNPGNGLRRKKTGVGAGCNKRNEVERYGLVVCCTVKKKVGPRTSCAGAPCFAKVTHLSRHAVRQFPNCRARTERYSPCDSTALHLHDFQARISRSEIARSPRDDDSPPYSRELPPSGGRATASFGIGHYKVSKHNTADFRFILKNIFIKVFFYTNAIRVCARTHGRRSTDSRVDVRTPAHLSRRAEFKPGRVNFSGEFRDDRPSTAVDNKNIDVVRRMIETNSV